MWWKSPACAPGWFYTRESHKYPEDAERDLQKVHIKKVKPQSSQMMTHCGTKDMWGELLLPRTTFFSASITSCALVKVSLRRAMFPGMYRLLWVLQWRVQKRDGSQIDMMACIIYSDTAQRPDDSNRDMSHLKIKFRPIPISLWSSESLLIQDSVSTLPD